MRYILDTCSYLRLAFSVHPLLGPQFFANPESAAVTSEVHREWEQQPKLQNKFHWAGDPPYVANRSANLVALSGKQPTGIFKMRQNIHAYSVSQAAAIKAANCTIPSPTDCAVLAYTFVLSGDGISTTAVSDDRGMGYIANELQIPFVTTLDLINQMYVAQTQSIAKITGIARYLDYLDDLPPNWRTRSPALFGVQLP